MGKTVIESQVDSQKTVAKTPFTEKKWSLFLTTKEPDKVHSLNK